MILAFVIIIPLTGIAQNWTAEQQEIIDQINANWASWKNAVDTKDFSIWQNEAQPQTDGHFWISNDDTLLSQESMVMFFSGLMNDFKEIQIEDKHFLAVKIYGDVAVVSSFVLAKIQVIDGEPVRIKQKNMDVFRKAGNKWRWSDTMITSENLK